MGPVKVPGHHVALKRTKGYVQALGAIWSVPFNFDFTPHLYLQSVTHLYVILVGST